MTTEHAIQFESRDQGEEAARADMYGLLTTLLHVPPAQAVLDAIAAAPTAGESLLQQAWADLVATCRSAQQEAVRAEYEQLFYGVGRPEVMLYGSFYLSGFLMEKPLAVLRTDLAGLGLQRADDIVESEDHLASLCAVMRHLITSDEVTHAALQVQRDFFSAHMQSWVLDCCQAIQQSPHADFYKPVAHLAELFFEVEIQAFAMA
jgi:TorA maturation chaperone TorD